MSPCQLPERPNLEQLKKQAKSLLHAAHAGDRAALAASPPPAFAGTPVGRSRARDLALHDAQSVVAREHGFASWNALREEVEARTLSFDAAVDEFIRAATGGASGRAKRLLALHPAIGTATFTPRSYSAMPRPSRHGCVLVRNWRPSPAARSTGRHCSMCVTRACTIAHDVATTGECSAAEGLVAIARRLLRTRRESQQRVSLELASGVAANGVVGRARHVGHVPLAQLLLEAGAKPTDGVTTHIAGGRGDIEALELLHRYGDGRQRNSRRRAAARLHPDLVTNPSGPRMAARTRRRPESRVGTGWRSAAACRGQALGSRDGRVAREARRRIRCAAAPTATRRTRSRRSTAITTARRGCWRTARRTSSPRSNASSPRARAPMARGRRDAARAPGTARASCATSII